MRLILIWIDIIRIQFTKNCSKSNDSFFQMAKSQSTFMDSFVFETGLGFLFVLSKIRCWTSMLPLDNFFVNFSLFCRTLRLKQIKEARNNQQLIWWKIISLFSHKSKYSIWLGRYNRHGMKKLPTLTEEPLWPVSSLFSSWCLWSLLLAKGCFC